MANEEFEMKRVKRVVKCSDCEMLEQHIAEMEWDAKIDSGKYKVSFKKLECDVCHKFEEFPFLVRNLK